MNYEIFENKSLLVFLPHQDDEINLVYGLLDNLRDKNCKINIVYSTNGDYVVPAKYRFQEAIDSLKLVGVKAENIIFLGYSDQAYENDTHLYHSIDQWISKNGVKKTYIPKNYKQYNESRIFNQKNFVNDIYDVINKIKADFLICVDYDSHPDHRALSLSFERALGRILNETTYRPVVYKAFAYSTSYKGKKDFAYNNPSTKFLLDKFDYKPFLNPYYNWDDRIRFRQSKRGRRYFLLNNIYYRGLLKHKSQYILNVYDKIINSDLVFWKRDTNNLLYEAIVKTTSGDASYLKDFMLFDSSNIMHGNELLPIFDKGYTIFDANDKDKSIKIIFNEEKRIDNINIYTAIDSAKIEKIFITYNNEIKELVPKNKGNVYSVDINLVVKEMEIKIISSGEVLIGELEIRQIEKVKNTYAKLLINDDFVYKYYSKDKVHFEYYTDYPAKDLVLTKNKNKYILKNKDGEILDEVIIKNNAFYKFLIKLISVLNKIVFLGGRIYQKAIKVLRNLFS